MSGSLEAPERLPIETPQKLNGRRKVLKRKNSSRTSEKSSREPRLLAGNGDQSHVSSILDEFFSSIRYEGLRVSKSTRQND